MVDNKTPSRALAWANEPLKPAPKSKTFSTKDSGERRDFDTGARRDVAKGKGRYDLLPKQAIHRLAQLFERGAEKYGENNWQKGIPLSVFIDSGIRHSFQAGNGEQDEDHLIAAAWNFLCAAATHQQIQEGKLPPTLNDIFKT